jgi:hypothetical protein
MGRFPATFGWKERMEIVVEIVVATKMPFGIFHVPFARKTWPRYRGSGGHGNLKANADN